MENDKKIVIGSQNPEDIANQDLPKEFVDDEFLTPTEEISLPSKGIFYSNKKNSVKIKYLTAEEDDVLYSPELIKSGKVLDALLQIAIIDKDLSPDDMLVGDRNAILIHLRRTGLGESYKPGKMTCPSCGEEYTPDVNLSLLKVKEIATMPDENGEYEFEMPLMKKKIKFRMLNGKDEHHISKATSASTKRRGSTYKISKGVTERYRIQIMEVEGNRDKLYISKFISAMPMRDSSVFREYAKIMSPGVDFNYIFECNSCGHTYEDEVPMTYKLFYPDADL